MVFESPSVTDEILETSFLKIPMFVLSAYFGFNVLLSAELIPAVFA